jgi:hypothetical protein
MIIAAFDLATNTGWAAGALGDHVPAFGSIRFGAREASHEARFAHALEWTSDFLKRNRVDLIVFEEPLHYGLRRGKDGKPASGPGNDEISYGLAAIVQAVAHLRGVYDVRQVRTIDVRRFFLGDNPKRKIAKRETVGRCRALGLKVDDDNQADAIALWHFQCAQLRPQLGLRTSPLFAGAAPGVL